MFHVERSERGWERQKLILRELDSLYQSPLRIRFPSAPHLNLSHMRLGFSSANLNHYSQTNQILTQKILCVLDSLPHTPKLFSHEIRFSSAKPKQLQLLSFPESG